MTTTEVLKRKCISLFTKEDRKIILNVVEQIHGFLGDVSHLLKAYYLHTFEKTEKGFEITENILAICYDIVSGKRTSIAQRTIKDKEVDLKNAIEIEKDDEVKKKLNAKLKREQAKKINRELDKDHFTQILGLYQSLGMNPTPKDNVEQFSVSHILNYSFNTLLVAYKNNIIMHFQKYVQKYIYCTLLASGETGKVKYLAKQITNNLLYNDVDELNLGSVLLPEKVYKSRTYDIENRPWTYLEKMVWMNKRFEDSFDEVKPNARKLYCPISLITTQIPAYIRLDTSGIAQLLMTKQKIEDFVLCFEKSNPNRKLTIKNKADLCSSYSKLTGILNPSDFERADFATQLWKFICKFDGYKKIVENKRSNGTVWVFDNAIMTDGYVCSFQITQKENLKRKVKFQKKKEDVIEEANKEVIEEINPDKIFLDENKFKILGNDPGKSDISFMTDGKRKCLRYTKKQRDQDTHKKQLQARSTKIRKNNIVVGTFGELVNPSIHDFECVYMSETQKKSCHLQQFLEYWKRRREFSNSCKVYNHPFFRQAKFVKYCKTKSSETKYFNKVKETFGEENKEIVIGWGNWGRNPNLKGSAPTPGIGFRRKAEQHFKIETVQEHFTSKTCPCCENRTLTNPEVGKESIRKHHLLRCTNGDCKCRWWNRNVVGSFNILKRFKESISALSEIKSLIEIKTLDLDNTV